MIAVAVALVLWIPALLGLGSAARRLFVGDALPDGDEASLAVTGFLGLLALSVAGTALHFFAPVGSAASGVAVALGLVFLGRFGRSLTRNLVPLDVAVFGALLLALSVLASGPVRLHDTGLYHQPALSWFPAGPLPVGLANLHRRFGLNTAWFPAAAFLGLPGIEGSSAPVASALVLFFFGTAVFRGLKSCVAGTPDASRLLLGLGALPLVVLALNEGVPSLSTDLPAAALTILSAHFLLRSPGTPSERGAAVVLAFFAVLVKLSALVFFVGTLLVTRTFAWGLAGAAAIWGARGVALSGYLLYPFAMTRLTFLPWAAPEGLARDEIAWARSWARLPGVRPEDVLAGWGWLGPWIRQTGTRLSVLALLILLVSGLVALWLAARRPPPAGGESRRRRIRAVALIAILSTAYWFVSAPDPRFGFGALYVLAALPLASALPRLGWRSLSVGRRAALLGLAFGACAAAGLAFLIAGPGLRANALVPAASPRPALGVLRTSAGETIFVPAADDRCWAAPVPCTPYFREDLVVRRDSAGRIRGFSLPVPVTQ